jgi:zinc protease
MGLSTHGVAGSSTPAQLETALQLLYQEMTAPGNDPEAFALLKRQLEAMVANRGRAPSQVFAEKLAQVNTSNHYTSQPVTAERIAALDRAKMTAFYRQRFSNAADFTMFVVGAFKIDDASFAGALRWLVAFERQSDLTSCRCRVAFPRRQRARARRTRARSSGARRC